MTSRRKPVTVDIRRRKALSEIASAADQRATDQLRSVVRLLSVLVLIGGLATLAGSVYIAVRAYTPVWFGDEWSVPLDYQALGGHYPLWKLWAQHNEHRIPIMKALQLMDLSWFKGDRRPLLLLNWLIQTSLWGLSLISYMLCAGSALPNWQPLPA